MNTEKTTKILPFLSNSLWFFTVFSILNLKILREEVLEGVRDVLYDRSNQTVKKEKHYDVPNTSTET